jgi:hypothetical protein
MSVLPSGSGPRIAALYIYPVKSCRGLSIDTMRFDALGPLDDRRWMLVDDRNEFLTQRELPRMALIAPTLLSGRLTLQAPGMPRLRLDDPTTAVGAAVGSERRQTLCWDDRCAGFDEGPRVAEWLSGFLGQPARLLRFDTSEPRACDARRVGAAFGQPGALTRFSDGFPLLVVSMPAVVDLNRRLAAAGIAEASVERFRPNVVIDGVDPFEEDFAAELVSGGVTLRPVKPCSRCVIPEVDPDTGVHEQGILQVLAAYRADPRLGGAVTFGQNCIVAAGLDRSLKVGDALDVSLRV